VLFNRQPSLHKVCPVVTLCPRRPLTSSSYPSCATV
jgi:hypothetical protein